MINVTRWKSNLTYYEDDAKKIKELYINNANVESVKLMHEGKVFEVSITSVGGSVLPFRFDSEDKAKEFMGNFI